MDVECFALRHTLYSAVWDLQGDVTGWRLTARTLGQKSERPILCFHILSRRCNVDAHQYLRRVFCNQRIPDSVASPSVLGFGFEIDDYSNLTSETEIRHIPKSHGVGEAVKCRFKAEPLSIIETGVCPVCGLNEFIPYLNAGSIDQYARGIYRAMVKDYSDWAMWQYVVDDWYSLRGINNKRLHVDHCFPVSLGYEYSIPEFVVGSPINCRLTTSQRNLRKSNKTEVSSEQVIGRYEQFTDAFPEWVAAKEFYTETGRLCGAPRPQTRFQDTAVSQELKDQESQSMIDMILECPVF